MRGKGEESRVSTGPRLSRLGYLKRREHSSSFGLLGKKKAV